MNALKHSIESPAGTMAHATLGRIGVTVLGSVAAVTTLVSAATVWLLLTRPVAVADALAEPKALDAARALAGLMVSILQGLIRYL